MISALKEAGEAERHTWADKFMKNPNGALTKAGTRCLGAQKRRQPR